MRFGIVADFRVPDPTPDRNRHVYAETLESIGLAERLGFDDVWLSEHHFASDGYCPSPLVVAAAIAARTKRIGIGQAVLLLPLHHPLRIAEDGAVVDLISGGRLLLGVGLGYRPAEFAGMGIEKRMRASLLEEGVEVIKQAWTEPEVRFRGRHFEFDHVPVRPQPLQQPRPPIWIGGLSEPAVRRAARIGDGLIAAGKRSYLWYRDELEKSGRGAEAAEIAGAPVWYFPADDPDELRSELAAVLPRFHNTVANWFASADQAMPMGGEAHASIAELERSARYRIATPQECANEIVAFLREVPVTRFNLLAHLPGLDFKVSRRWLSSFAEKVIPQVRARYDEYARPARATPAPLPPATKLR